MAGESCWVQGRKRVRSPTKSNKQNVKQESTATELENESETEARTREPLLNDLPPELLRIIIEHCDSYKEVARLRAVCHQFNVMCSQVLKTGFLKLQEAVELCLGEVSQEMAAMVQRTRLAQRQDISTSQNVQLPARYRGQRALLRHSLCLFQLRSLSSQLRIARAATWAYVNANVCPFFYGELVDVYYRIVAKISRVGTRNNLRTPAIKSIIGRCRAMTQRFLARFHLTVEKKLLQRSNAEHEDKKNCTVLPGLTILELIESCIDKQVLKTRVMYLKQPTLTIDATKDDVSNPCRLQVSYSLAGCWLGVVSTESSRETKLENHGNLLPISGILREIIWTSNHDYLMLDRRCRDQVIQGDRIYTAGGYTTGRNSFNVVDRGGQVFYFGHQMIEHEENTWMSPHLKVGIDITCDASMIPQSLLLDCLKLPTRSSQCPDADTFHINLHVDSIEFL